ncbi:MAG: LamG domain-containing protein [Polyangiaceae bacterium]
MGRATTEARSTDGGGAGDDGSASSDGGGSSDDAAADGGSSACGSTQDLRAWWEGEGTTGDALGTHPGAWTGTDGYRMGQRGRAFATGASGFVQIPDSDDLDFTGPFTIDAWVNTSAGATSRIVDKIAAGSATGYLLDILGGRLRIIAGGTVATSDAEIPSGRWVHVAGVYRSPGVADLYVDGAKVAATGAGLYGPVANALPVRLGADSTEATRLEGGIDEVGLYGRALDDAEMADLAANGRCEGRRAAVGGTVRGLGPNEYVRLLGNGEIVRVDWVSRGGSNTFTFAPPVIGGGTFPVTVVETSPGVTCRVSANGRSVTVECGTSYGDTVRADSPIAYFPLDESASPVSDDNENFQGVASGNVRFGATGLVGGGTGIELDGTGKIDVPFDFALNPLGDFSYEAWYLVPSMVTIGRDVPWSLVTSREAFTGYMMYVSPGSADQAYTQLGGNGTWFATPLQAAGARDVPHHMVTTYDATTKLATLYVDGVVASSVTVTPGITRNSSAPFRIGAGATEGTGQFFFRGTLDEVALYGKALTPADVARHYEVGTRR